MKPTKSALRKTKPTILLIGVGRFGEKYLETLTTLEKEGFLTIKGAVVATIKSKKVIEGKYNIPVWTALSKELLAHVDAACIVTPPETHFAIAMKCLPFTNILIEKPLAVTSHDAKAIAKRAKKFKRVLMVGHIFRFDPVVKKLKPLLASLQGETLFIKGKFINPISNDLGRDISLELPHYFDIISSVLEKTAPSIISTVNSARINTVSVKYSRNTHAELRLGWEGAEKIRTMYFYFSTKEIHCDFLNHMIRIFNLASGTMEIIDCSSEFDPLREELRCFLKVLKGKNLPFPDAQAGIQLVAIAERAKAQEAKNKISRPKVAVIGAGIFGTNCAIELSKFCDVALIEKNGDIMQEASFINQYRHHWGYHYPRSGETVRDIRGAIGDFENLYAKAVIRDFPTYYCIAKKDSKTSAKDYVKFCRTYDLPFTLEYPDKNYVDRKKISLSLRTMEPIYNYEQLKKLVSGYIKKSSHLSLKLGTSVTGGRIEGNGQKSLIIANALGKKQTVTFDYVINATYANYNQFTQWFNFPIKPVRIDLVEALIVKLPLPKISLAIMDGPFTNLVPTHEDNTFTLVHIKESILERYVPTNGLPRTNKRYESTQTKATLEKSIEWFPILKKAQIIETRYVFRAVNANREHDDARPSDLSSHGFGCWSVLGGKIVNCVATAKEIAREIKKG